MKKLLLAMAAALVFSVPAFAGADDAHDFKTLAPKILKSPKSSTSLKNPKDDVSIVYGGEDISRKITDLSAIA
jgi:hypothetical protein